MLGFYPTKSFEIDKIAVFEFLTRRNQKQLRLFHSKNEKEKERLFLVFGFCLISLVSLFSLCCSQLIRLLYPVFLSWAVVKPVWGSICCVIIVYSLQIFFISDTVLPRIEDRDLIMKLTKSHFLGLFSLYTNKLLNKNKFFHILWSLFFQKNYREEFHDVSTSEYKASKLTFYSKKSKKKLLRATLRPYISKTKTDVNFPDVFSERTNFIL